MTNLTFHNQKRSRGFSLVEMMVVIAVIGVIAAIAIPNIGSIGSSAKVASSQRNAQSIVSMYQYGTSAGIVWSGSSRNEKIQSIITGTTPSDGAFQGQTFRVPTMSDADQKAAYPYIGYDANGDLFYDKSGGQSST